MTEIAVTNCRRLFRIVGLAIVAGLLLSACAETQLGLHALKTLENTDNSSGTYKVGKPYQIKGVWYYPKEQPDYNETGIASWYGEPFHGRKTANGETYDMNALTAAHKTLPMPVKVRVTNLENGRSLMLTVNDRGPFVAGRIIDVSRRAAQLLGFEKQGTAKVRVEFVGVRNETFVSEKPVTPEQEKTLATAAPLSDVEAKPLDFGGATVPVREPIAVATVTDVDPVLPQVEMVTVSSQQDIYVQAGAFGDPENARRMMDRLASIGNVNTTIANINGKLYHRVRIGPLASVSAADEALGQVQALNIAGARIIVD